MTQHNKTFNFIGHHNTTTRNTAKHLQYITISTPPQFPTYLSCPSTYYEDLLTGPFPTPSYCTVHTPQSQLFVADLSLIVASDGDLVPWPPRQTLHQMAINTPGRPGQITLTSPPWISNFTPTRVLDPYVLVRMGSEGRECWGSYECPW